MQPIIEQATQALRHGRFDTAKTLVSATLEDLTPDDRLPFLEVLAQAQEGLHDRVGAIQTWQQAYDQATAPAEKARLFEQLRQAYQAQQDYTALVRLAQDHVLYVQSPQERAACLLVAGEALMHLQQYQEARQQYFAPALEIAEVSPETRLYLWHYLGLSYLAEHAFSDAVGAFRQLADLALGQHYTRTSSEAAGARAQSHHLRNAARFYDGVIHLLYQRPQQAVQVFQDLRRPLTAVGNLNVALFLALAYRFLQHADAAARALQPLTRLAPGTEALRGPAAVVRAGIANLGEATAEAGEYLEAALTAPLGPRTSWEPSWRALLLQELGLVCHRLGARAVAIACYEEGLKIVGQRAGAWPDLSLGEGLKGMDLLAALGDAPLQTWSDALRGETLRLLQALAWLYDRAEHGPQADTALALALRFATTPEQTGSVWFYRAWLRATTAPACAPAVDGPCPAVTALLEGIRAAQEDCASTPLAEPLQGIAALLQGDEVTACDGLARLLHVPEAPELQALCIAGWLWVHARQGTLAQEFQRPSLAASPPWQTHATLAAACTALLAWTATTPAPVPVETWLSPLLQHQKPSTLAALRQLCRAGYLPEQPRQALMAALTQMRDHPDHRVIADQLVALHGGPALLERIEALVADLDQQLAALSAPPSQSPRQHKKRPQRSNAQSPVASAVTGRLLDLIRLLSTSPDVADNGHLPDTIRGWLLRYPTLAAQAPEVVSALLGVLRQHPASGTVMQTILERVPLSRRQRQALEVALQTPLVATASDVLSWEGLRHWPLGRLLDTVSSLSPTALQAGHATRSWYVLALVLAQAGLLGRATDYLSTCLQLQPQQPLVHYTLAQLLSLQQQPVDALQHTLQAWQGLQSTTVSPQVFHLEVLNQILTLLEATQQYGQFQPWLQTFQEHRAAVEVATLDATQQQRLREEDGAFALAQALALVQASAGQEERENIHERQLLFLAQAIDTGAPPTQHVALCRQGDILARVQRYAAATAAYTTVLQRWPDDQHARLRLALLTILQQPEPEAAELDRLLADALTLACTDMRNLPEPLTPQAALQWLQQAPPYDPRVADIADILTLYGEVALQRQDFSTTITLLTPVYAVASQPRQAYALAEAHYAHSMHATSDDERFQDSEQALAYIQAALTGETPLPQAVTLLPRIQGQYENLLAARQREERLLAYYEAICDFFMRHNIPFHDEIGHQPPDAPWLELREVVDLDEQSGELVTTIWLGFNHNAASLEPHPSEQDVALYAQHQRDAQLLVSTYGMDALPWPQTAYEGQTDFAVVFPERLALNRDLLFVAFADLHALLRYARVLQHMALRLPLPQTEAETPTVELLATAARYLTILPVLRQRLQTLATTASAKAVQRQVTESQAALTMPPTLRHLRTFPAFVEVSTYFQTLVEPLLPHLDMPPQERTSERPGNQHEERLSRRPGPAQRQRRPRPPRRLLADQDDA